MLDFDGQLRFFTGLAKYHQQRFDANKFRELCTRDGLFYTVARLDRIWEHFEKVELDKYRQRLIDEHYREIRGL